MNSRSSIRSELMSCDRGAHDHGGMRTRSTSPRKMAEGDVSPCMHRRMNQSLIGFAAQHQPAGSRLALELVVGVVSARLHPLADRVYDAVDGGLRCRDQLSHLDSPQVGNSLYPWASSSRDRRPHVVRAGSIPQTGIQIPLRRSHVGTWPSARTVAKPFLQVARFWPFRPLLPTSCSGSQSGPPATPAWQR